MKDFKKGDRVRLYGMAWGLDGVGAAYVADPLVIVSTRFTLGEGKKAIPMMEARNPISNTRYIVHRKQVRKLKTKRSSKGRSDGK